MAETHDEHGRLVQDVGKVDVYGFPGKDDPIPTEIAESLGLKIESTPEAKWRNISQSWDPGVNYDWFGKPGWGPFNPNVPEWARYENRDPDNYPAMAAPPGGKKAEVSPRSAAIGIMIKVDDDLEAEKAKLTEKGFKWSVLRSGTEGPSTIVFFRRGLMDSTVTSAIDLTSRAIGLWAPPLTAREWWVLRLLQGESREKATAEYNKVVKFLDRLNEQTTMSTIEKDAGVDPQSAQRESVSDEAVARFVNEGTSVEKISELLQETMQE